MAMRRYPTAKVRGAAVTRYPSPKVRAETESSRLHHTAAAERSYPMAKVGGGGQP